MTRSCFVALALVAAAACGSNPSPAEKQAAAADQAAKSAQAGAQQAKEGANDMAKGLQQVAQGFQQMAQNAANGQNTAPVDFEKLQTVLPNVGGWTRGEPEGHQMTAPFPISNTKATYTKGDMRVEVTVTDSAFNQLATAPFAMMTAMGFSERTSSGYKRATTINGAPSFEEWNGPNKHASVGMIVGKRFIVEANGDNLDSADTLKGIVQKIDLNALAALK